MNQETLEACVQYGDYTGTSAADRHDRKGLNDLAERFGVDPATYFIFGVEVQYGETRGEELLGPHIYLLAHDTAESESSGVDQLTEFIRARDGSLPYSHIRIDATFEDVVRCFKRLDIVLRNSHIQGARRYELQG